MVRRQDGVPQRGRDCGHANPGRGSRERGHMTNKNLLLGRSKPSEKLSRAEIAALDQAAAD